MKNLILTLGIICICQMASAQDLTAAGMRAVERYNSLNAVLHFTEDQQDKIRNLINGIEEKQEYVKYDANLSDEQRIEFAKKNEEGFQQYLRIFLDDTQKAKYEEILAQ